VPRSRGEPAGHRLGARYARRRRDLAALIHPAQLAHHLMPPSIRNPQPGDNDQNRVRRPAIGPFANSMWYDPPWRR